MLWKFPNLVFVWFPEKIFIQYYQFYTVENDNMKKMVADSKFKDWPEFLNAGGENHEGYIGLQDHGNDVWFRNIKIRIL